MKKYTPPKKEFLMLPNSVFDMPLDVYAFKIYAYLVCCAGKNVDYLAPIIAQTIKEEIRSTEKNISQILFKVAVESAMLAQIQAFQIQLTPTQMEDLRRMCSQIVAKNNGIITFEDAYAHQHR